MANRFIFGATSSIAEATARRFAADGDTLFLVARDSVKLQIVADDLRIRGADTVFTSVVDARDFNAHQLLIDEAFDSLGSVDTVLVAHGTLPDQRSCEESFDELRTEFETNALGVMSLLTHAANRLEKQGGGTICVISSVAGDRGRQSNYVYGAAKGAVSIFLQGLRNRLNASGVHVVTVKPGFVDTPMTRDFSKNMLWATPEKISFGIYTAINRNKNTAYLPWFWSVIMWIIRAIPETIFKRLHL
ncbi:SDR family oxidoreductase [Desulfosediminicola flagellatus]|uniref:SDR family oxidoreductase n=1 Tax=Desulfosediminicola flagellatus TaxID=2569541 RepID=UPI0010AC8960|nr:SDR family oxidoreductase [Desulfosediminicola flagellatus]